MGSTALIKNGQHATEPMVRAGLHQTQEQHAIAITAADNNDLGRTQRASVVIGGDTGVQASRGNVGQGSEGDNDSGAIHGERTRVNCVCYTEDGRPMEFGSRRIHTTSERQSRA
jgi:hypothetical protein